jgi:hypothetical protein
LTFDACFPDSIADFVPNKKRTNVEYVQYWFSFKQQELEDNAPESAQSREGRRGADGLVFAHHVEA